MSELHDIDPFAPGLTDYERSMLQSLLSARAEYCNQGRGREYHAMGKALMIAWHYTRQARGEPTLPPTDFGSLDLVLPMDDALQDG
jgi:hypothetical protein